MNTSRPVATLLSIALLLIAASIYMAWLIADTYHISEHTHFKLIYASVWVFLLFSVYWISFATLTYRFIPSKINTVILLLTYGVGGFGVVLAIWLFS